MGDIVVREKPTVDEPTETFAPIGFSPADFIKNIISSTCKRTNGFEGKIEDTNGAQPNDNLQQDQNVPELYRFMGLYICKERNGVRSLGTVFSYYLERNLLKVQYKDDWKIEYLTPMEALYNMARHEDFVQVQTAPSASGSKKRGKNKKKADVLEESPAAKKKRTAFNGPKI